MGNKESQPGPPPQPNFPAHEDFDHEIIDKLTELKRGYHVDKLKKLGEGGFAQIYKLKKDDVDINGHVYTRTVVIKLTTEKRLNVRLDDQSNDNKSEMLNSCFKLAENESKILKTLRHAFLVGFVDHIEEFETVKSRRVFGLVMDYCKDGTLEDSIKQQTSLGQTFPELKVKRWFFQLASALEYCHAKHIVHGDVKPGNVLITKSRSGWIKLGDFGLAKQLQFEEQNWTSSSTSSTFQPCSAKYCSFEVLNGEKPEKLDDVWSYAVTFYQTCTLRFPFEGTGTTVAYSIGQFLDGVVDKRPRALSDYQFSSEFSEFQDTLLVGKADRPSMKEIANCPFFQNDRNLIDFSSRCPASNWHYLKEKAVTNRPWNNSIRDIGMQLWISKVQEAKWELMETYRDWSHNMDELLNMYEEKNEILSNLKFSTGITKIVGSGLSMLLGGGLSIAGIVITGATFGAASPVGVGLIIAGASVAFAGGTAGLVADGIRSVKSKAEMVPIVELEKKTTKCETALENAVMKMANLMPEEEFRKEIEGNEGPEKQDLLHKWNTGITISRNLIRAGGVAVETAFLVAKSSVVASGALLPVGAVLDIVTIALSAVELSNIGAKNKDGKKYTVKELLDLFTQSLFERENLVKTQMNRIIEIVDSLLEKANLPDRTIPIDISG